MDRRIKLLILLLALVDLSVMWSIYCDVGGYTRYSAGELFLRLPERSFWLSELPIVPARASLYLSTVMLALHIAIVAIATFLQEKPIYRATILMTACVSTAVFAMCLGSVSAYISLTSAFTSYLAPVCAVSIASIIIVGKVEKIEKSVKVENIKEVKNV